MNFFTALLAQMPDAVAKGLIWGLMALGVYITYKILDFPDLTVDGSLCTGGAVAAVMIVSGIPAPHRPGGSPDRRRRHRSCHWNPAYKDGYPGHSGRNFDPAGPLLH